MSEIKRIINIVHNSVSEVPAYRSFLKTHKINPAKIKTMEDFKNIPVMDKKNFIYKHPLNHLYSSKKTPAMIYASSGSSGKPTFWLRDDEQEELGGEIHLQIFRDIFGIKPDEPTLVIVSFSTGIWVAGNYTLAACRYVSRQGFDLTTVTPGIEKEDILNCLENLAPQFKNVILAGYPPFVMDLLHESIKRGIRIPRNLRIMTSGDKFSEGWRDAVAKLLKLKDGSRSIISLYGCAEAAVLGFETPLSIFLRRKALQNPELYGHLFGSIESLPALVQYDPKHVFFEEFGSELIITARTSIPLIRYNMHDIGKLFSYEEIAALLSDFGLLSEAKKHGFENWKLPFIVLKGRTDVAVTFYALNIYPENFNAGIEDSRVRKFLTGNFLAYNKDTHNHKTQKLFIRLQLGQKIKATKKIKELIKKSIVENLIKVSIEYRKLFSAIGNRALPEILLTNHEDFGAVGAQGIINILGKKPKVIFKSN